MPQTVQHKQVLSINEILVSAQLGKMIRRAYKPEAPEQVQKVTWHQAIFFQWYNDLVIPPYLSLLLTPFQNSINLLQTAHSLLTSYVKMVVFCHLDINQFYLLRFPATSCCVHMKFTEWAMVPSQYHLLPNYKDYRSYFLHPKRHSKQSVSNEIKEPGAPGAAESQCCCLMLQVITPRKKTSTNSRKQQSLD